MEILINESSLHGQYASHNVRQKFQTFIGALKVFDQSGSPKILLRSEGLFEAQAIHGIHLGSTLGTYKELSDFLMNNLKNVKIWESEKVHKNESSYDYDEIDYVTKSIAEIAERELLGGGIKRHLLNFCDSTFGTAEQLSVVKDKSKSINVSCSFDGETLIKWLIKVGIIDPKKKYDAASAKHPPMDYQTVLSDSTEFTATGNRNQGRKIYIRIATNELWVVDNQHYGGDAHIEVFSANRIHLGISMIDKMEIIDKYKVKGRTLD